MGQCDICGHGTDYLEAGTGQYEGKKLCKLCDDRENRLSTLAGKVSLLEEHRASLVVAAGKCIALIDLEVSLGRYNNTYSLIRNTLNHELENLGISIV